MLMVVYDGADIAAAVVMLLWNEKPALLRIISVTMLMIHSAFPANT